jgi:hypothetical protein
MAAQKDAMIDTLKLQIEELKQIRKIQHEQIDTLNNNIQSHCSKKLKLIEENAHLAAKLRQEQTDRQNQFKVLFEGLNVLTSEIKQKES